MAIKAILFDLDGTLLPMDQDVFAAAYMEGLVRTGASAGYDPKLLAKGMMAGIASIAKNTGERTNMAVFWDVLSSVVGEGIRKDAYIFDEFYKSGFQEIRSLCGFSPDANTVIQLVKQRGMQAILATNPLFPRAATESRIRWAGLDVNDFALVTTYEDSRYCKPNPAYYLDILHMMHLAPEECLMVGNDVDEDMIASSLGIRVFLLTDCLINRKEKNISVYPHGSFTELMEWIPK